MFMRTTLKILFIVVMPVVAVSINEFARSSEVRKVDYLSALEEAVVREVNLARTYPRQYASFLKELKQYYNGKRIERPGETTVLTKEGVAAVKEAIRFLRSVDPVPSLSSSKGLSLAAKDHVSEQGPTGATGHTGTDGSQPADRVSRYGTWQETIGENIAYGRSKAREVVMGQIIDDGVPGRGHRDNIFEPDFRVIGVGCGPHATYETMCVITFAGGYIERASVQ